MNWGTRPVWATPANSKTSCTTLATAATFSNTSCGIEINFIPEPTLQSIPVSRRPISKLCICFTGTEPPSNKYVFCSVITQAKCNDLVQQLGILNAAMCGRVGEVLILCNLRVWVRFEQITHSIVGNAIIQTSVTAQAQVPVNALRKKQNLSLQFG